PPLRIDRLSLLGCAQPDTEAYLQLVPPSERHFHALARLDAPPQFIRDDVTEHGLQREIEDDLRAEHISGRRILPRTRLILFGKQLLLMLGHRKHASRGKAVPPATVPNPP